MKLNRLLKQQKKGYTLFLLLIISSTLLYSQNDFIKGVSYIHKKVDVDSIAQSYCKLDIYFSKKNICPPTLIYFHGGGLTAGEKYLPQVFADKSLIVVTPGYRLSPVSKCPSYIEDAAESVAWVFNNIHEYGGSNKSIYLMGYSSGAYLSTMIFLDKKYLLKYNVDPDSLAGFFAFSGQMTTHFQVMAERGIKVNSDNKFTDDFAPLFHIRKTLPYSIFFTGDRTLEMAGRYVQNSKMVTLLDSLGNDSVKYIEFKGKDHGTFLDTAMLFTVNTIKTLEQRRISADSRQIYEPEIKIELKKRTLNIFCNEEIKQFSISDITGKLLFLDRKKSTYNMSFLDSGFYLVTIQTNSYKKTYKIKMGSFS